jgi:hypothetical protein
MKSKIILHIAVLFGVSGCATGPATYEVFKENMDNNLNSHISLEKKYWDNKSYNDKYYIYFPKLNRVNKNCVYGYLVKKDDPKKIIVNWVIISGKQYCKERQATTFIQ